MVTMIRLTNDVNVSAMPGTRQAKKSEANTTPRTMPSNKGYYKKPVTRPTNEAKYFVSYHYLIT